jgi:hypothetical protein
MGLWKHAWQVKSVERCSNCEEQSSGLGLLCCQMQPKKSQVQCVPVLWVLPNYRYARNRGRIERYRTVSNIESILRRVVIDPAAATMHCSNHVVGRFLTRPFFALTKR